MHLKKQVCLSKNSKVKIFVNSQFLLNISKSTNSSLNMINGRVRLTYFKCTDKYSFVCAKWLYPSWFFNGGYDFQKGMQNIV